MKIRTDILLLSLLAIGIIAVLFFVPRNYEIQNIEDINRFVLENNYETAVFSGGCFWCSEADFEKVFGVEEVISGYSGGEEVNPSYELVSSGKTRHRESVIVIYDEDKVSYSELLETFWKHINPTDDEGQFIDRGFQYTSAIYYKDEKQKELAEESKRILEKSGRYEAEVVTQIILLDQFYPAEEYHQDYYKKNSLRYKFYRFNSGRDQFIDEIWNSDSYVKPSDEFLKDELSELQYKVTQKGSTEFAFRNEYFDKKDAGIYVDIVSGEPLFSSTDKYDSETGWPSFTKPLVASNIVKISDRSLVFERIEVRSKYADSHLGHVFSDGIEPTGLRYCINSAALKFIPAEDLEVEGYGEWSYLFEYSQPI